MDTTHGALVNRANFLNRQQWILKGLAPRARFFHNDWKLNVEIGTSRMHFHLRSEKKAEEIRSLEADKLRLQEKCVPYPSSSQASKRPLEELSLGFLLKGGIVPTKIEFWTWEVAEQKQLN